MYVITAQHNNISNINPAVAKEWMFDLGEACLDVFRSLLLIRNLIAERGLSWGQRSRLWIRLVDGKQWYSATRKISFEKLGEN